MVFFMCFNILESYVISLRGQDSLKTQKCLQEVIKIKIAIYLSSIDIIYLKKFHLQSSSIRGIVVSTLPF